MKKLERILNHQQHLHFNCKRPEDYDYEAGRSAGIAQVTKDLWDIPTQVELGEKFPFTGFVEIDGTVHECESCEHEKIVRDILYNNSEYFKRYRLMPASNFDKKPQGMLQEEYFLMKYMGFVKVSSFEKAPTKRILFRYDNLTWKQSDIIYPQ